MTKTTATVMLIIFIAVLAFVGVFTFVPEFEYGAYGEFYSPATLIQKCNLFSDTLTTTYSAELDENVTGAQLNKIINQRLSSIYGLYSANISTNNGVVTVTIPEIVKGNGSLTAEQVMEVVSVRGALEILAETTYAEENVILSNEHYASASTRKLVSGEYDYYVAIVKLNAEGTKAAKELGSSAGTYAIDGNITLTGGVQVINESTLYLYGSTMTDAKELAGYINSGVLGAELKLTDSVTTESNGDLFLFIGLAVVVVALAVFYLVRYKTLGVVGILSQLFTIVVGTVFAGLVHLEILNIFALVGMLLGIALQTYFTVYAFENINAYQDNTFASAKHKGFANSNKRNIIVHAIALVVGVILWVIPTAVTAPLGNVLVYLVVLSFVATMGLNRLFGAMVEPFIEGAKSNRK